MSKNNYMGKIDEGHALLVGLRMKKPSIKQRLRGYIAVAFIKSLFKPEITWFETLIVITASWQIVPGSKENFWFLFAWLIYLVIFRNFTIHLYKEIQKYND